MDTRLLRISCCLLVASLLSTRPSPAARGGPDAGGWAWADSNEPAIDTAVEAPTLWTTIASPLPGEGVFPVTLSFPFTLYDVTSNTAYLSSNGWISLLDPGNLPAPVNPGLPDPARPNATVAFFWDDLGPSPVSWARHGATANADVIEVYQWHPVGSTFARVLVQFHRSGSIKVVYAFAPDVASATVGIEDGSGSAGSEVARDGVTAPGVQFGSDYALFFYPTGGGPDCSTSSPIGCQAIAGTTLGGPADAPGYGCSGRAYAGAERVYRFSLGSSGSLRATLGGLGGRQLHLFLLAGCSPFECLAGGSATLDVASLPAGAYELVVDGVSAADDGPFTLDHAIVDNDCNRNRVSDRCDVLGGASLDCNGNQVPDECDVVDRRVDCNRNGVPDSCDLTDGTSEDCDGNQAPDECDVADPRLDCNRNGVPDSCDLAGGFSADCNSNQVPDECDVTRTALDCNRNGVPDSCDVAAGTSSDCNGDGRPDECKGCPVDVVFLMDTSGSMNGVAAELCSVIDDTIARLGQEGILFDAAVWGIAGNLPGGVFGCLTDTVQNRLGSQVPGPPEPVPLGIDRLDDVEDWGPGTAVVAGRYPWTPGAFRIAVPMSDEGALSGNPVDSDDQASIEHAVSVARAHGVPVSPISPNFASPAVEQLALRLADGTGGTWFRSGSVGTSIADAIVAIARDACTEFGGTAEAGEDQLLCAGDAVRLDGSASSWTCPGGREFRWLEAATEVCGWSQVPTCDVAPAASTEYTLEVRCLGQETCGTSDRVLLEVEALLPPGLGNTLRSVRPRAGTWLAMSWVSVPGFRATYNLYRSTARGQWPQVLLTGLPATVALADVPAPPALYFYRVSAVGCSGLEGP